MIPWRWSRWGLLTVCCASSVFAEGENPADLFTKLDKNQDGQVTADEAGEEHKSHFERLLRRGDKDSNQTLSKDEFSAAMKPDAAPEAAPPGGNGEGRGGRDPGAMFERLDANKDGKVSKNEIPDQMPAEVRQQVMRVFEKVGKEELTREELMRAVGESMRARAGGGGGEMLQRLKGLDKNADGKVTREEFPADGKERLEGLLRQLGTEEIDLSKADQLAQKLGRPEGERRPEGDGPRPDGDRPRGDGEGRPDGRGFGGGFPGGPGAGGPSLMSLVDRDHNGRLSREEFAQTATYFGELDRNRDGQLDPSEIMGMPAFGGRGPGRTEGDRPDGERMREGDRPRPEGERREGDHFPEARPDGQRGAFNPEEMWKRLDKDGDGTISKEEAPEPMKANFGENDTNKDGKLDREEMRASFERRIGNRRPEGDQPREGDRPRRPDAE
ncbi:MAG: hypothetical protein DWH91_03225 [Planctomycetota bacterium]|nr:MAG: hypothetical protein DWH91_03225 [Planctomycetota bacterium]